MALGLFGNRWIRLDLVSLLVLSALALSGLVTLETFAGFYNPAAIAVWAMIVISERLAEDGTLKKMP